MEKAGRILAWVVGVIVVIGIALRLLVFDVWTIPNDSVLAASIAPTLRPGDTVLLLRPGTPGSGDLVRCPDPENEANAKEKHWVIGRLVGLPGDTVYVAGVTLRVNRARYDATEACKEPTFTVNHPDSGHEVEMRCTRVGMGGGWHFRGVAKGVRGSDVKKLVGTNKVFLLSDNRSFHDDSRDFGTIDQASCNRRIVFRLWGAGGWTDSKTRMTIIR